MEVRNLMRAGMITGYWLCLVLGAMMVIAPTASAHHEAIFGPQSALLYSSERFVRLHAFPRQLGY
jgi:hypothetical protein